MKTNIKTLAAALAAIISVGVLTSCSANTAQTNPEPTETTITATSQTTPETTAQPQTTSAKETTISSTKPETQTEKTTAPTSAAPPTTAPATTAASTTYTAPATTVAASTTKPATESTTKPAPASTAAPAPEWTESAVSGTRYVNTAGIYSRSKAVLGAPTVKQYNLNDAVSVTAVTNTGYYKLSDGSFIHADYLGADKVTAQTASTTKPSTSSAAPTVSKPAATTKPQSTTTTKPASTTKKPSTTTPSSGSSQSGGDWKGYDMDDPDFPWDEYLKETDGGGSNFNWDDLFGNMTMPWEEEEKEEIKKQQQLINAWNDMSETEHRKIAYKLGERTIYYFNQLSHKNLKTEKYVQLWGIESGLQGHWEQVGGHFGVAEYVYGFDDDSLNKIAKSLAQGYFQSTEKNEYDDKKYIAFPVEFHIQNTFDGDNLTVTANFQSFWSVDEDSEKQMLKEIGLTEKEIQEVISD